MLSHSSQRVAFVATAITIPVPSFRFVSTCSIVERRSDVTCSRRFVRATRPIFFGHELGAHPTAPPSITIRRRCRRIHAASEFLLDRFLENRRLALEQGQWTLGLARVWFAWKTPSWFTKKSSHFDRLSLLSPRNSSSGRLSAFVNRRNIQMRRSPNFLTGNQTGAWSQPPGSPSTQKRPRSRRAGP